MGIDLTKKSSRLLASRRYTSGGFATSVEAFTQVLDLGSDEIYSQASVIPSSNLPFSGSSQNRSTQGVIKYYYRQRLTKSQLSNEVWFFLDPSGSNSGIGAQIIDSNQKTNFISPKYSIPTLAPNITEQSTPGYGVTVLKSTSTDTASLDINNDKVNSNFFEFDYKTGILQFTDDDVPTDNEYVYVTAYQYIGKTVTDTSSSISTRVGNLELTSSNRIFNQVTASNVRIEEDLTLEGNMGIGGSIFSLTGFGVTIDDITVTSGSVNFGSGSLPSELTHQITGSVSITGSDLFVRSGSVTADSFTGIFVGALSSSVQISSEITGAFYEASHSLQNRVQALESVSSLTSLPTGLISGSDHIFTAITASGNISASGLLFISASATSSALNTLMYDTATGQVYYTGSYGGGGGGTAISSFTSIASDVTPDGDGTRDLGSPTARWEALYAVNTFFGGIHEINLETIGISQLQTGTVLVSKAGQMVPCNVQADPLVMGIVTSGSNYPVIMGAEPVLVDGPVYEGDYIITSNRIGYGKAVPPDKIYEQRLFGKIIAQALETNLSGGSIKAMIRKM